MKPALRPVSLLLALPLAVPAQVSGGSEVDFNSRYVWRGIACSDGPGLQANDWASARGFTLNGWANVVLTKEPQQGEVNSVSASLTYDKEYAGFRLEPMIEYWADRRIAEVADPATGELSLNISRLIGPVRVFLLQTVDAFRFRGAAYSETGITRSFAWKGIKTDATARWMGESCVYGCVCASSERRAVGRRRRDRVHDSRLQELLCETSLRVELPAGTTGSRGAAPGIAVGCGDRIGGDFLSQAPR